MVHRCGSNLVLLWLWCEPALLIQTLAQEIPYAIGVAIKILKKVKYPINQCVCVWVWVWVWVGVCVCVYIYIYHNKMKFLMSFEKLG